MTETSKGDSKAVGQRIAQVRKEHGLKQVELAELIGVSERTMMAYESGEVMPYRKLRDLERVLQTQIAWFLHGEEATHQRDSQLDEVRESIESLKSTGLHRDYLLSEILEELRKISAKLG